MLAAIQQNQIVTPNTAKYCPPNRIASDLMTVDISRSETSDTYSKVLATTFNVLATRASPRLCFGHLQLPEHMSEKERELELGIQHWKLRA